MTDTIIVAVLAFLGTALTSYFANKKTTALIEYRLKELEERVDKHNNLIERTYKLEERVSIIEKKEK